MERLPHGYTNDVHRRGDVVIKTYRGPDASARQQREVTALRGLAHLLPVPEVLEVSEGATTTRFITGSHGQDLLETDAAPAVLRSCGRLLSTLQTISPSTVFGDHGSKTLLHGDFGPNNLVMSDDASHVLALVDWEWSGTGSPYVDLGWCELIARMHHPDKVRWLPELFEGYGDRPPCPIRQNAMLARCAEHAEFAARWSNERGMRIREWIDTIGGWEDIR